MTSVFDFKARDLSGQEKSLGDFRGNVLLMVNVASRCGFTPQYKALNALYQKFKPQGFSVLGFPCNQFGAQEPGSSKDIQEFCDIQFKIEFPLFEKIDVNGNHTHPLYKFLKSQKPGLLGIQAIKWNFTKFLVDREGQPHHRYAPSRAPETLEPEITKLLATAL